MSFSWDPSVLASLGAAAQHHHPGGQQQQQQHALQLQLQHQLLQHQLQQLSGDPGPRGASPTSSVSSVGGEPAAPAARCNASPHCGQPMHPRTHKR